MFLFMYLHGKASKMVKISRSVLCVLKYVATVSLGISKGVLSHDYNFLCSLLSNKSENAV